MTRPTVLIAPHHLRHAGHLYAPALAAAGFDLAFPPRHAQMTAAEVLATLPGCAATLAGSEPYTRPAIAAAAARGLKVIARAGVGYDAVDVEAATDHGVAVTIAAGANQDAVGEHVLMAVLALFRDLVRQHQAMTQGRWPREPGRPVRGARLGVVGFGRTGKAVAVRAQAFGMAVAAADPYIDPAVAAQFQVPLVPLGELLPSSDVISLHVPLTADTRNLIDARALGMMMPSAVLVNAARGGVVDEAALAAALTAGRLAGAAVDVFADEPPVGSPLVAAPNVLLTAHTAGIDAGARDDMGRLAAAAIVRLFAGDWPADWVVNPEVRPHWRV